MSIDRNKRRKPGESNEDFIARLEGDFIKKYGKRPEQVAIIEDSKEKRIKPPEINVSAVLSTGTVEQLKLLKCPICGNTPRCEYSSRNGYVGMRCRKCGAAPKAVTITEVPKYAQYLTI